MGRGAVIDDVRVTRWQRTQPPAEKELLAALAAEGISAMVWGNAPGDRYGVHAHTYDKVIYVVRGSITFTLPERAEEVELNPGDRLDLPAGVKHGAIVGMHGVTCLEAHAG